MAIAHGNDTEGQNTSSSTSYTLAHSLSAGSGNNRKLVVAVFLDLATGPPVLSCTFNGVSMNALTAAYNSGMQVRIFWLDDADLPASSGSYNIVASSNQAGYLKVIASDFTGVKQGAPDDSDTGTSNSTSVSVTTTVSSAGSLVWGGAANASSSGTWSGHTSGYSVAGELSGGNAHIACATYKVESATGDKTLTDTNTQSWYMAAAALVFSEAATAVDQTIPVGTLSGSASVQTIGMSLGSAFGLGSLSASATVLSAVSRLGYTAVIGILQSAAEIQAVSTKHGFGAVLNLLEAAATIEHPAVSRGSTLQVGLLSGDGSIQPVTLGLGTTAQLDPLSGNAGIHPAGLSLGTSLQVAELAAQAGISPADLALGITQAVEILEGAVGIHPPSLSLGATVGAGELQAVVAIASPSLSLGVTQALGLLEAAGAINAVVVQVSGNVTIVAGLLAGSAEILPHSRSLGIARVLDALEGQASIGAVTTAIGVDVLLGLLAAGSNLQPVTVGLPQGVTVTVGLISAGADLQPVGISISAEALLGLLAADVSLLKPDLSIDWTGVLNLLVADGKVFHANATLILLEPQAWKILFAVSRILSYASEARHISIAGEPRTNTYHAEGRFLTVFAPPRLLTYGGTMGGWQAMKEVKAVAEVLQRDFEFAWALKRGDTIVSCTGTIQENGTTTDTTEEMLLGIYLYAGTTKVAWEIQGGESGKAYDLILLGVSAAGQHVQETITFKVE